MFLQNLTIITDALHKDQYTFFYHILLSFSQNENYFGQNW